MLTTPSNILNATRLLTVYITQQCFALFPQVNFPANNLNFHWSWRWWDRIQDIFSNLFYFKSCWYFHYWFRTLNSNHKWAFNCALHSPEQRERLFVTSFITLCKPDVNSIQKQCFWPNIPSFTLQTLGKKGVFMLVLNSTLDCGSNG